MKKSNFRTGVFETNSSSSHSISIAEEASMMMDNSLMADQDGIVTLTGGEFGWEWAKYNDATTKANYVAVMILHLKNDIAYYKENVGKPDNSYWQGLPQWASENYETVIKNFQDLLKDQIGCTKLEMNLSSDYKEANYSYIDHQSIEDIKDVEWLLDKEKIRQFIFNQNSWLFTGNDNDTAEPDFYDVPVFKDGKKIMPKYKYELRINGYRKTTKFKEYPNEELLENGLHSILRDVEIFVNESGKAHFDDDRSIAAQIMKAQSSKKPFKWEWGSENIHADEKYVEFRKEMRDEANAEYNRQYQEGWNDKRWEKMQEVEKELRNKYPDKYTYKVHFEIVEI